MKQNKENTFPIDVDKAWNTLHARLEEEQLLPDEVKYLSLQKRKMIFRRVAAAATILGFMVSIFNILHSRNDDSLLSLQNTESSGVLVVTLEDGSTVYLSANASISYPAAFEEDQRKVELNGDALFCVTKDANRPFIVEANGITVEVVGTVFAVQSSLDNSFELLVKEGKVNVHSKNNQTRIPVVAGETVQLNKSGLNKSGITNFRIFDRYTDKMCFKDEKLNNIVRAINIAYGTPTIIADESLNNRTLTVAFENNSVENMMELICSALNLKQINKQDTIFIRK
ncbi:MAG: FecR domain-containing protein [Dysgonamonadaceae bacterium]|jgi:ferric-dicitrate binding protein FerR (iron transport regulator)|nr:FecR domain-containing protein [Dysgonamonadaceae bacterium]